MVRTRPVLPAGHGEVVERPVYAEWPRIVESNRRLSAEWDFSVGGMPVDEFRRLARAEFLERADGFSAVLGVDVRSPGDPEAPIVATGHQPELYHPGVWVKDFLLDRLAVETGASSVDVVVDTDGFDAVSIMAPCMTPGVARCQQYLAVGTAGGYFAGASVPSESDLTEFCGSGDEMLASLPAPAVRRHFASFCSALKGAAADASNLAELVTIARRRYEASAGTAYLELPVTAMARSESFRRFVAHLVLDAAAFHAAYNAELDAYRALTKTRSAAQPFPNLDADGERRELPLWVIVDGRRSALWAEPLAGGGARILADDVALLDIEGDHAQAALTLADADLLIAPKAVVLTMFTRTFCSDLFIHGIGGGRYDQVTDGVIRRVFGVEPPAFVVASMTMYLPLGAHVVSDDEVAAAKERVNRLEHNPDALLAEVDFDDAEERARAVALAREKTELVTAIAQPDADKKALGARIREVNQELSAVLAPLKALYVAELETLQTQAAASGILTDRTYPFCLWDPAEIADKVR